MKPDYKNWIPKGMLVSLIAGTVLSLALLLVFGVFGIGVSGKLISAQFDSYRRRWRNVPTARLPGYIWTRRWSITSAAGLRFLSL